MHITKEYYTGPFCNGPRNPTEEEEFDLHPNNAAFLNPAYPYLNQFLAQIADSGICFGIGLWKIEMGPAPAPHFSTEDVRALLHSEALLQFQLWTANARECPIEVLRAPTKTKLVTFFGRRLHQMQIHGGHRPLVSATFCKGLATEFLEKIVATSGTITDFFEIGTGWTNWFALDSNHDLGYVFVTEGAVWLLTFSESD
jgi:hypothetical protein